MNNYQEVKTPGLSPAHLHLSSLDVSLHSSCLCLRLGPRSCGADEAHQVQLPEQQQTETGHALRHHGNAPR